MTKPKNVFGSANDVSIPDDLGSAAFRELIEQLNKAENTITRTLSAPAGQTARAILGRWRYAAYIKEISVENIQTNALVNANTDIFVRHVAPANADFVGTPVSPTTLLGLEGFATGNLAGPSATWADDFVAGTNCDAKSGSADVIVTAGDILYVEFVNNEVATRSIEVSLVVKTIDKISLQPKGISNPYHDRVRGFRRKPRSS